MNLETIKVEIVKCDYGAMCDIFKIIKKNKEQYTKNKNGVFFNLGDLSEKTIKELKDYVAIKGSLKLFD